MANTENMTKWAEALESGEFEQGRNHLAIVDLNSLGEETGKTFYCCLGVACEVAMRNGVELVKEQSFSGGTRVWSYDGESGVLPHKVWAWLGLDDGGNDGANPEFKEGAATELNDDADFTFAEIGEQVRLTFLTPA